MNMVQMVVKVVNNECKKVGEARKHTKYGNIKMSASNSTQASRFFTWLTMTKNFGHR